MSERDELALELFIGDNGNQPRESSVKDWQWFKETRRQRGQVEHYEAMAEHMIAAGYRKPRTITTREELEALGYGSVIRSEHRHYWVAHKEDGAEGNQGWAAAGTSGIPDLTMWLPATVLHEPAKEAS